jgi:hypothetical protein
MGESRSAVENASPELVAEAQTIAAAGRESNARDLRADAAALKALADVYETQATRASNGEPYTTSLRDYPGNPNLGKDTRRDVDALGYDGISTVLALIADLETRGLMETGEAE